MNVENISEIDVIYGNGQVFTYKGAGLEKFKREYLAAVGASIDEGGILLKTQGIGPRGSGRYRTAHLEYEIETGDVRDTAQKMKSQSNFRD